MGVSLQRAVRAFLVLSLLPRAGAQIAVVQRAAPLDLPAPVFDGNSPAFWSDGRLKLFTSTGSPVAMSGSSLFGLSMDQPPEVEPRTHYPLWIESAWKDDDGIVYAWYHHEPGGLCPGSLLTAPRIGALRSSDGGRTFRDLGLVLESGDPMNCAAKNGFFGSGHGDFSVILDRDRRYFYFFFSNYGGPLANQGVAVARMAFEDREQPVGAVKKFYAGTWTEPGIGGAVTPIFPARAPWEGTETDAFWGPAVQWNTSLERYVIVMNHVCCRTQWPQEGAYVTYNRDLADPTGWSYPIRLLGSEQMGSALGYYPQLIGTGVGETDSLAGQLPRLFVQGISMWEVFFREATPEDAESPVDPNGHSEDGDCSPQAKPGGVVLPESK